MGTNISIQAKASPEAVPSTATGTSTLLPHPASTPKLLHHAPAGASYASIQDAGQSINKCYCKGYPNTAESFLLPPLLQTKYPELSSATNDRNKPGERAEYLVFKAFKSLIRKPLAEPILILYNFKLDCDNHKRIKENALKQVLPGINLKSLNMHREHDFIIMVKDLGFVVAEVKRSTAHNNIADAEKQLENSHKVVQCIMQSITGPTADIPSAKIIIIPNEMKSSPTTKTALGSFIFYKDVLENMDNHWEGVMADLRTQVVNPINSVNFQSLVDIMSGLWSMKPYNKRSFKYDEAKASEAEQMLNIDGAIDTADICSKIGRKTSQLHKTKATEIFKKTKEINVMYLTPPQKDVFDNYPQVILRGHAGTGKSILCMLKILETLQQSPSDKLIILAPKPHHLRCHHFLANNNFQSQIITEFPFKEPNIVDMFKLLFLRENYGLSSNVLVMTLDDFFGVSESTLMSYDMTGFHVMIDDLQGYRVTGRKADYWSIAKFIEKTYKMMEGTNLLLWVCLDSAQQLKLNAEENGESTTSLFTRKTFFNRTVERKFNIPTVKLIDILRNSEEIIDTVHGARDEQCHYFKVDQSRILSKFMSGHEITSGTVVHHRLKITSSQYRKQFMCERVCEELHLFATTSHHPFNMADFAVLFDTRLQTLIPALRSMLLKKFNVGMQTIEQSIIMNNSVDVVVDTVDNANSFECAVVVIVTEGLVSNGYTRCAVYNLCSRARTRLIVIDTNDYYLFHLFENTDLVEWEWNNGVFQII